MSSFKFCYLEACNNLRIKQNEKVILKIEEAVNSNTLNFSAVELSDDTCKAFGLALSKDVFLQELDLSNCMLNDDGLSSILSGLYKNRYLKTLILKGNNIRSLGTEAIGKFLRHNNCLENLYLEWNGIGIFPEKFKYLCDGLINNNSLKLLDLKNNQLNHICAQCLTDALYRNSTLQRLDLRWNAIGLIGGRALLNALTKNKSILKLDVTGNDIPLEIQKSIELIISAAAERYFTNNENVEKTKVFASKLKEIELEQTQQLKSLMDQLDQKDKDMLSNHRWSSEKLIELQEALSDKNDTIENLTKKLQEMEKKASIVTEEKNGIALTLNEMEIKFKESKKGHKLLLEKERQDKEDMERKLLEEIGSLKEENLFIKQQVQDYKVAQSSLEDQIIKLKSSVTKLEKMLKLEEQSFQEQMSLLNEKHQESLRETDQMRKNELARIKNDFSEVENNLKQKITILENKRSELEKLVSEKECQLLANKTQAEEKIEELKKETNNDKETLKVQMEERIQVLETANKKQEELLKDQLQMMHEIRKISTENDLLLAEEAHRTLHLQQCLEAKDAEIETAIAKVKFEVKEQLEELEKVKKLLENSNAESASLREKHEEIQNKQKKELEKKEAAIEALNQRTVQLKTKIKEILLDEKKRSNDIQLALASCINSKVTIDTQLSDSGEVPVDS